MTETADIIIIGGGVMGASIAYHLGKQGGGRIVLLASAVQWDYGTFRGHCAAALLQRFHRPHGKG